ncbi:MAG: 2-hydroxyacyl-CoA dehydratase family protein [Actinobacteria bacterium]|nr:2-hydroxyacyl-CoA dehydratase family protein [Actinomycetota bacterium]MCL5069490.1 2-hydroxyacyl-CoA dehydratase family protein [Actinomycetota bacterium]
MTEPESQIRNIGNHFSNSFKTVKDERLRIGWLCTYMPEEIIISAGFTPARILGENRVNKAEGYFPTNFCPYLKSSWESILNDISSGLSAIIFTNSCDGMRRLYDICKKYKPQTPSFMLDVPRINTNAAIKHFSNNLFELSDFLGELNKSKIEFDFLKKSIELVNKKRTLLKKLNQYYSESSGRIDNSDYFDILKLSMISETEIFIQDLHTYLEKISEESTAFKSSGNSENESPAPRIMIIGNFINEDKLWKSFKELNCKIAASDLCNSSRYYEGLVEVMENTSKKNNIEILLGSIAARYLKKPQCMRMANLGIKLNEIKENVIGNNIKGVIFLSMKFCDNTLLFYPLLRQQLSEIGTQSLFLEIEHNNFSEGQIKTRIQAFLEIL